MVQKIVNKIKEAEVSAKSIIEDRRKQNQAELDEAAASAKEKIQSVNAAKLKSIQEAIKKADKEAEGKIEALKEEYESKISNLNDIAKRNLEESVRFIIAKI
jgi:vacuolar-type H+-ATPase subunit H